MIIHLQEVSSSLTPAHLPPFSSTSLLVLVIFFNPPSLGFHVASLSKVATASSLISLLPN